MRDLLVEQSVGIADEQAARFTIRRSSTPRRKSGDDGLDTSASSTPSVKVRCILSERATNDTR
ncbi:hypothetical protein L0Z14_19050 [Burkholderia multivorans]|nr:hypothetical protein [Burkholderia multivorans]